MAKDVVIELVSDSDSELVAAQLAPGEAVLTYVDATTQRAILTEYDADSGSRRARAVAMPLVVSAG